jgi:hypothetical protein
MPKEQILPYSYGMYPELDNLPEGTKVSFNGEATIVKTEGTEEGGEGSMGLQIDSIELDAEGEATRELGRMTKNDSSPYVGSGESKRGF